MDHNYKPMVGLEQLALAFQRLARINELQRELVRDTNSDTFAGLGNIADQVHADYVTAVRHLVHAQTLVESVVERVRAKIGEDCT